jgi:hypothetical protein
MGSMIIWNACGLGGRDKKKKKRRCARNLVRKLNLDVLGVLKIKLENISEYIINLTWG